ncbi:MAG: hypothetical protein R3C71_03445 [Candidatus Krumholzibacteriia bacterium]
MKEQRRIHRLLREYCSDFRAGERSEDWIQELVVELLERVSSGEQPDRVFAYKKRPGAPKKSKEKSGRNALLIDRLLHQGKSRESIKYWYRDQRAKRGPSVLPSFETAWRDYTRHKDDLSQMRMAAALRPFRGTKLALRAALRPVRELERAAERLRSRLR